MVLRRWHLFLLIASAVLVLFVVFSKAFLMEKTTSHYITTVVTEVEGKQVLVTVTSELPIKVNKVSRDKSKINVEFTVIEYVCN